MESWSEVLRGALDAPGARYACLADPATGAVVAAHGTARWGPDPVDTDGPPGGVPADASAVLGWAATESAPAAAGPAFADAVITTDAVYHLVRVLPRDDATLLAYLQVDRARGNLALARRALLALPVTSDDAGHSPAPAAPAPAAHPVVPAQASAPEAERTPPLPVPLPRRAPGSVTHRPPAGLPPPALAPAAVPTPAPAAPPSTETPNETTGTTTGEAGAEDTAAPAGPLSGPPDQPGRRWADDLRTMARILAGLRRLEG